MKKHLKYKPKLFDYIIIASIATSLLLIASKNIPIKTGLLIALMYTTTIVLIVFLNPKVFSSKLLILLLFYGLISVIILKQLLWIYMTEWNIEQIRWEYFNILFSIGIFIYYRNNLNYRGLLWISTRSCIFVIISILFTNLALFYDPLLVRDSASTAIFSQSRRLLFDFYGVMGYSYMQAVIYLIPILIYFIKIKKGLISPKILVTLLIIIIITQIRSQVFANIIVTIIITIISFLGSKNKIINFSLVIIIVLIIVLIPPGFYMNTSRSLSNLFDPGSELHYKFYDLSLFLESPDIDTQTGVGGRGERYPILFDAFLKEPILGYSAFINNEDIMPGAHIYWMNRLTLLGLFGFAFFVSVLYYLYRNIISIFNSDFRFYYNLSVMAFILIGLMKAVGGSESWIVLIIIIPGLYFLPTLKTNKVGIKNT